LADEAARRLQPEVLERVEPLDVRRHRDDRDHAAAAVVATTRRSIRLLPADLS